jgi:catechol 2,3-dioxygenase-like lactoylglutathione lyase family enzyme
MKLHKSLLLVLLALVLSPLSAQSAAGSPASPNHITGFFHVGFWIRNLEKSRAFYEKYLGFGEAYTLAFPDGTPSMVVLKVNDRQCIFLFPNPAKILPNGDNLDHLGLETDDAAALRDELAAKGVKVGAVHKGRVGDLILTVKDPDGHTYEIVQFLPEGQLMHHQGQDLPAGRISAHLRSVSISVADLSASSKFYHDTLGFNARQACPAACQGKGGGECHSSRCDCVEVPNTTDYIVLNPCEKKSGAEQPWAVSQYCLEVPDVAKAVDTLTQRAAQGNFPPPTPIIVGPEGKRETSVTDPDGMKVVIMEACAAGGKTPPTSAAPLPKALE